VSMRKTQDRGLDYARTRWRPSWGHCWCRVCRRFREDVLHKLHEWPPDGWYLLDCDYVNPERAFAEKWEAECKAHPGLNFGMGTVQDLMVRQSTKHRGRGWQWDILGGGFKKVAFWLTPRERVIVATVVQWLGTQCGMGFLRGALGRCGFEIVERETIEAMRDRAVAPSREAEERHRLTVTALKRELEQLQGQVSSSFAAQLEAQSAESAALRELARLRERMGLLDPEGQAEREPVVALERFESLRGVGEGV